MEPVSYLRTPAGSARGKRATDQAVPRVRSRATYVLIPVLLTVGGLAVAAFLLASARASLTIDSAALARVGYPLGGGTIQSVTVTGARQRKIPVEIRGERLWPRKLISAHELVSIDVVVRRPGWISWLSGSTDRLHLSLRAPSAGLRAHYLTLAPGAPLRLRFNRPIEVLAYGPPGQLRRRLLARPRTVVTLPRDSEAGTYAVAAAPRRWEKSRPALLSWFPAGGSASAVASPQPGSQIGPNTAITLTFSKPVADALGSNRPPVSPITPGVWHTTGSHTIVFRPEQYGYGLGATVNIALPSGVRLVGGQQSGAASTGTWTVPPGSTLRMQEILAMLGYLPLRFGYAGPGVARTQTAQEAAAVNPPRGHFRWRYGNVPPALRSFWQPGSAGVMTQGALMAFENDHGITPDGVAGPVVWRSLMDAAIAGRRSTFGYSFVSVSVSSQSLDLWHDGRHILSTPVNTGIASRPTATGTYPVYEHIAVGTMSGTNPDGSHYDDPGIQWISYFNGGDALHAFTRAQYGFPQSLGCVEMPLGPAGQVWPYTPIGTLVHVA